MKRNIFFLLVTGLIATALFCQSAYTPSVGGAISSTPGVNITLGAGAGSGATLGITAGSTDGNHGIAITTGSSPAATSTLYTMVFTNNRGHSSLCSVTPELINYSALNQVPGNPLTSSATGYTVLTGVALAASTTYQFFVICP